ncbi:hypothetical protein [Lysobacter gummosus]|uniref:hypothetical protein n=1 Tax=Lysobacter gummosus TaxID=262324 RepID=UPI00363111AC
MAMHQLNTDARKSFARADVEEVDVCLRWCVSSLVMTASVCVFGRPIGIRWD